MRRTHNRAFCLPSVTIGVAALVLAAGAPANLCLFRYSGGADRLRVERTICRGEETFRAG